MCNMVQWEKFRVSNLGLVPFKPVPFNMLLMTQALVFSRLLLFTF